MGRKLALPADYARDRQFTADLQLAFGRNVKEARLKAGFTQGELAERSGLRQDDISRIEAGQVNVTLRTMGRLARAFGRDVSNLLLPT